MGYCRFKELTVNTGFALTMFVRTYGFCYQSSDSQNKRRR